MKQLFTFSLALFAAAAIIGCRHREATSEENLEKMTPQRSIYHWKTVFGIDSTELAFLQKQEIDRIYLRMFDVATEPDFLNGATEIVPIATTRFTSPIPNNVEIVPVTYITIDALMAMAGRETEIASLIVERLMAMSSYNGCGKTKEIQLDCDWTATTKEIYNKLCRAAMEVLQSKSVELSITVRLHQLKETPPPADRGVLMLYNTGALKDPYTDNSILNIFDVEPYIKPTEYSIPLDYAYPAFGWGVKFNNDKFVSIVPYEESEVSGKEHIRYERPSVQAILEVKELVEDVLGKPQRGNIIYHLDYSQLKHYTDNEISQILSF
jgi:hypothetical protein